MQKLATITVTKEHIVKSQQASKSFYNMQDRQKAQLIEFFHRYAATVIFNPQNRRHQRMIGIKNPLMNKNLEQKKNNPFCYKIDPNTCWKSFSASLNFPMARHAAPRL